MSLIKVLTVDDSMLMCRMLQEAFQGEADIQHVAHASDGPEGLRLIEVHRPDVVTLDVEMPGMNGLEFLERIMSNRPLPVVMFSSHTAEGTEIAMKALELGAVDFLQKPRCGLEKAIAFLKAELLPRVRAGAVSRPRALRSTLADLRSSIAAPASNTTTPPRAAVSVRASTPVVRAGGGRNLIAIGASTGGVAAVRDVLSGLPADLPPIVVTQHMPEGYTARFAERLERQCTLKVQEAVDGELLKSGHVYIAPGTAHLRIKKGLRGYAAQLDAAGAPISGHRPSVDALFTSVAEQAGGSAIGVILTGMGRDGADGMLKMRQAGAHTIGQNRDTCVVYGMPKSAFEAGAVVEELALERIADAVTAALTTLPRSTARRRSGGEQ